MAPAILSSVGGLALGYPITRSFPPLFSWLFIFFGVLISGVIFTFAVGGAGYESIPFGSTDFNSSGSLWYENIVQASWIPKSKTCEASAIKPGESKILGNKCMLIIYSSDNSSDVVVLQVDVVF